jgi:hypothetical protein
VNTTLQIVRNDDLTAHIEDTRLYSLFRHGRSVKLTWNELTRTEKDQQIEAQGRAEHHALFSPCGEWL